MRIAIIGLIIVTIAVTGHSVSSQTTEVVFLDKNDSSQNCCRIWKPKNPLGGLVVLLPGYGGDYNEFNSEKLPFLLSQMEFIWLLSVPLPVVRVYGR